MSKPDWSKPFSASWYWTQVSRSTGRETQRLDGIVSGGTITRSLASETFESASINYEGVLNIGSDLLRCHMVVDFGKGDPIDVVLGTFLVATPSRDVQNGRFSGTADLTGRLAELHDAQFAQTFSVPARALVVDQAERLCTEAGFAVVADASTYTLSQNWVMGASGEGARLRSTSGKPGTRLAGVNELLELAGFCHARTDPYGRVLMRQSIPITDRAPAALLREGKEATFLSHATDERDLSDVANVVRAVYSTEKGCVIGEARDNDPTSATSIPSLGWERCARFEFNDLVSQKQADDRAKELLKTLKSVEHRVTVSHVYRPIACGDIVEVDWSSTGIKGRYEVLSQDLSLGSGGCLVKTVLRAYERW